MRRLIPTVLALLLTLPSLSRASLQPDAVTTLLLALEHALRSGTVDAFVADSAPDLTTDDRERLSALVPEGTAGALILRERERHADGVSVDIFISSGNRAVAVHWLLELSAGRTPGRVHLLAIRELARFTDLVALALDEQRQFAVSELTVSGPDFSLTLPSGHAFVSEVDGAPAAVVLLGRAVVTFTPADPAEQGQLRVFAGTPALRVTTDEVFLRLNPADFESAVTGSFRASTAVDASVLARARRVFTTRAIQSHQLDLGDLTPGSWSVMPPRESLLVEFRTNRDTWLTYARSPEGPEDVSLFDRERRRQISLYRSGETAPGNTAPGNTAPDQNVPFEVTHTDLDVTFDPDRLWMNGSVSLHIRMRRPGSSLSVSLSDTLVVSSVSSPELGPLMPLRAAGRHSFFVGLPTTLDTGDTLTLEIRYHGRIRPLPLTDDLAIGGAPVAQDAALLQIPLAVEPRYLYSTGSVWYPQPASGRHATASMRVAVPDGFHVVATGTLFSATVSPPAAGRWTASPRQVRTFEYRADRPVRYLSALVSRLDVLGRARTPLVVSPAGDTSPGADGMDVEVLIAPGQSRRIRTTPDRVGSILTFFAERLGGAPYPTFTVAALEDLQPGGHSPAYFAVLNQPVVAAPLTWMRDPIVFSDAPDFFLAHEVAHQWFGQAVAGRDYHGRWISEGFAHYLAWMYITSVDGDAAGHRLMARMRATIGTGPVEGPIHLGARLGHLRNDPHIFRRIVYNKSAVVLHMLRRLVGEEAFFAGLQRIYARHRFALIGLEDVERAFQDGTPMPLTRFFDRWIRGADVPDLRFSWVSRDNGIVISVEQTGEIFDVPYDVRIRYSDGREQVVTLRITEASAEFPVDTRGSVRRVDFDDGLTLARVVQ